MGRRGKQSRGNLRGPTLPGVRALQPCRELIEQCAGDLFGFGGLPRE